MRKKRYLGKLEWIEKEIEFMKRHEMMSDETTLRSLLYSLMTAVEAVVEIVVMLVKEQVWLLKTTTQTFPSF